MKTFLTILGAFILTLGLTFNTEQRISETSLGASQTISSLTAKTSLSGADLLVLVDNQASPATTKRITVANATSSLQTLFDGRYQTLLTNSAGLLAALSDETGSGLAVFGTSPTLTTPTISGAVTLTSATLVTPLINVAGTEAVGDLLYLSDSGGTLSRLGIGADQQYLQVSAGLPSWGSVTGQLFTASTTVNSRFNVAADNLTDRALVINGLAYKWPSTRGASSTVLTEDGSGNVEWQMPMQLVDIGVFSTTTASVGTIVVSHNLAAVPNLIKIFGLCVSSDATPTATTFSDGTYRVSGGEYATVVSAGLGVIPETSTTDIIRIQQHDSATYVIATISAVDSTTFTVNFTTNPDTVCNNDTSRYKWEVYR